MERLYCLCIINLHTNKPTFIGKYLLNANYSSDTVLDILENESLNIEIGTSHAFEYEGLRYSLHFVRATELICVVSTLSYKTRLLAKLIFELKNKCEENNNDSKKTHLYLKDIGDKYNDPSKIDVISRTENKLNDVKSVMHQNIEMALQNCIKLEDIELKSQELSQSAGIFKGRAKDLKNKMWWKNLKMKLIIGFIILSILGIITGILCAIYPPSK